MWRYKSLERALSCKNTSRLQQLNTVAFGSLSTGETGFQQVSPQAPRSPGSQGSLPASRPNIRQVQSAGFIYGRLTGIGRNTLKADVLHFFDDCGLKPEDIKLEYNRNYSPLGICCYKGYHRMLFKKMWNDSSLGAILMLPKYDFL